MDVLLPRQQQLKLFNVGQQNPRLAAGSAHDLTGTDFLRRVDCLAAAFAPHPFQAGPIGGTGRSRRQPDSRHVRLPLRRLADINPERNPRTRQQPAQPHQLVFRQRVHGIDDDGADARGCALVPQGQALTDNRVEKAFGLSGSGPGGDEGRLAVSHGPDGALLVDCRGG